MTTLKTATSLRSHSPRTKAVDNGIRDCRARTPSDIVWILRDDRYPWIPDEAGTVHAVYSIGVGINTSEGVELRALDRNFAGTGECPSPVAGTKDTGDDATEAAKPKASIVVPTFLSGHFRRPDFSHPVISPGFLRNVRTSYSDAGEQGRPVDAGRLGMFARKCFINIGSS